MKKYLMKCGHIAQAKTNLGEPCCVLCVNDKNAFVIEKEVDSKEEIEGRRAKCSYCGHLTKSSYNLPFFEHRPEREFDSFYCGCGGGD